MITEILVFKHEENGHPNLIILEDKNKIKRIYQLSEFSLLQHLTENVRK